MTKKVVCLALALTLLMAFGALAQQTGLEQERAAYYGDDATPEGAVGAVLFWGFHDPATDLPECMGIDTLVVEFARAGVTGGEGYLRVLDAADDSLFFECRGDDPECVDYAPSDLDGTNLYVTLDEPLQSGHRYYIQMDADMVRYGDISCKAFDGKTVLQLLVGDFGLDEMEMAEEYRVGQSAPLPVIMGSMGSMELTLDETLLSASQTRLTQDGTITLTPLREGETEIDVAFYDQDGEYVNGLIVPITIMP